METPLEGASFTIQRIDENAQALSVQGDPVTGTTTGKGQTETGEDGKVQFTGLTDGYYIVSESKVPDGYIRTGEGSFYIRIEAGVVQMVERNGNDGWKVRPNEEKLTFAPAEGSTPAQATVGNDMGAALPNSGGPGILWIYLLGAVMVVFAVVMLRKSWA